MRNATLAIWLVLIPLTSSAQLFPRLGGQRAGISALTFLKMETSPRAAALGGAGICLSGDAYSLLVHPAAMSELKGFSVGASHTFWAADINYSHLTATLPTLRGTFGISLQGLSSGAMPVRTVFQPEGTGEMFYAYYMAAGIGYSRQLTDHFSWGTNVRFIREQLAEFSANTVVVDLGFLYQTDFKDLRFAVLIQNFGPNSTLSGSIPTDTTFNPRAIRLDAYPAPTVFKLAVSFKPWESADGRQTLTTFLQLNHPNDNSENIRIGVEYAYAKLLFLRAGYKINVKDESWPTAGIGLRMQMGRNPLVLDYAMDPLRYLGMVHRVGLTFGLNKGETR